MISSSGDSGAPDAISMSRRNVLAASVTAVSSARSWIREVSRAAVFARMVATPSSRLSSSVRSASVSSASVLARARSSRMSNAITWNLVRLLGPTLPRSAAFSTSRTARASTGISPVSSPGRACRCDDRFCDGLRCVVVPLPACAELWPDRAMLLLGIRAPHSDASPRPADALSLHTTQTPCRKVRNVTKPDSSNLARRQGRGDEWIRRVRV